MTDEYLQMVVEQMHHIHHTFGGVLTTMDLAVEVSDTLNPAEQAQYECYWQETLQAMIQDLNQLLDLIACASLVKQRSSEGQEPLCETKKATDIMLVAL